MQPRWKDGCKGMLTVNAIFAGFSAVLLVNLIMRVTGNSLLFYLTSGLALAALYCFAMAAEWITDALDEALVETYVRSMITYNLGVVFILLSLAVFFWDNGRPYLSALAAALTFYPWVYHLWWFVSASKVDKKNYYETLSKTDS